jgi:acetylornithine/N-succinyldiaminopimelate aminotransferase
MRHILQCHDIVKMDFVRAENCYLYDEGGRRFVDLESGIWSAVLGHSHPRVNGAIREQVERVMHLGTRYPHQLTEAAAVDVLSATGLGDGKATFLSSGSEAVEFAAMAARRITGRRRLLAFASSYLAAYGSAGAKSGDNWELVDWGRCEGDGCLAAIPFEQIGAFVFEPGGSGSGFARFPPAPLVEEIARRAQAAGGLLVVNEITTGMGRTGKWFGFEHYAVAPDIVALGKGLGNGYPVSAVAMRREVAERLEASGLRYAQSHQNDPLGCRVAREVIAELREGGWVERGARVGAELLRGLRQIAARSPLVKEARGRGMLLGLELRPNAALTVQALYARLLERGYLTGFYPAGNMLRLDPSLTLEEADAAGFLETLDNLLCQA